MRGPFFMPFICEIFAAPLVENTYRFTDNKILAPKRPIDRYPLGTRSSLFSYGMVLQIQAVLPDCTAPFASTSAEVCTSMNPCVGFG